MIQLLNSDLVLFFLILFPLAFGFAKKRKFFLTLLVPSLITTTFLVQVIKKATAISRPFINNPQVLGIATNIPTNYSFPSLHTALATFFAWSLTIIKPTLSWLGFGLLLIIALSRVYFGLHFFQDLIGGFTIATLIFWLFFIIHRQELTTKIRKTINLRRKIVHLFYGFGLVFLIEYQILDTFLFLILTLGWGILVLSSALWLPKPLKHLILYFERNGSSLFLAKGPFLFTLSSFVSFLLFPKSIAMAAIINLAIGDSVNALVGFYFKGKKKRLEASLAALFATALVSLQYISAPQALAGAVTTSILEYTEPKIGNRKIDDNLLIPPLAGATIWLVGKLF